MYWFGQARREKNEFIAVVKYGICLDILAKGSRANGILKLCCAVLGMAEADSMTSDGRSLELVVRKLYEDGRSQIAHGGRLALLQELPVEIYLADSLTSQVLTGYVAGLDLYGGPDSYDEFLAALPQVLAPLRKPTT